MLPRWSVTSALCCWLWAANISLGQFVAAPSDLQTLLGTNGITVRYKKVPNGICETSANVKSFAGYVDVGPTTHMFFWLFEARNGNPTTAPLTVRLDGGPGASSMNGLFGEMGPCTVDATGKVVDNPLSFSQTSNLLFVDQPATVGFSYTELVNGSINADTSVVTPTQSCTLADPGCGTFSSPDISLTSNTTVAAADVFYKTMQGFMAAFPQYSVNGVHINGQSYGGHYVPIFADTILQKNKLNTSGAIPIKLKSITIEDGFFDTRVQFQAYQNYTVSPGNPYDLHPYNDTLKAQLAMNVQACQNKQFACNAVPPPANIDQICAAAESFCAMNVEEFFDTYANRSETDIRQLLPDPYPPSFFVAYLNRADVQAAIGASVNFTVASLQVATAFGATGDDSRTGALITKSTANLLEAGVTVALFTGDADYDSNMLGAQVVADNVAALSPSVAAAWKTAGFVNMTTLSNGQVPGQTRQADLFSFSRIYFAGHYSAFHQPEAALRIQQRAVAGLDITTGQMAMKKKGNKVTKGTPTSTFREGSATIQVKVTPPEAIYNTTTHVPDMPPSSAGAKLFVGTSENSLIHPLAGLTSKKLNRMLAAQREMQRKRSINT